MKNKLVLDINNYIAYLNSLGLYVTVHGKGISGILEHNIHQNPFCTYVKTSSEAWNKCIKKQRKVFAHCKKGCLFGMCYAGVEEYVYFANDTVFVSVSGYGIDQRKAKDRIKSVAHEFSLNRENMEKIYTENLKHTPEDEQWLSVLIRPLCHMLNMLQMYLYDKETMEYGSSLFHSIFAYVQLNFMQNISINDIAHACSCSTSTVSHLFKKNTGHSVKAYVVKLRIEQAKKLLQTSDLPINTIAAICGFENTNYFSSSFKKVVGNSPKEYRKTT